MAINLESFLIINTFGIGDVLFSTPLIRNLKEFYPQSRIYYLCNKKTAPILRSNPLIHKTFVYERDEFVEAGKESFWKGLKKYLIFLSEIKKEKIDVALDLSLNTPFGFSSLTIPVLPTSSTLFLVLIKISPFFNAYFSASASL